MERKRLVRACGSFARTDDRRATNALVLGRNRPGKTKQKAGLSKKSMRKDDE